jgi:hypothetical protein
MDFFTVSTLTGRVLFVLVLISHDRRRIVHVNLTEHPTSAWTAQQLVDAFPEDSAPRWLLRDRDSDNQVRRRIASLGIIRVTLMAPTTCGRSFERTTAVRYVRHAVQPGAAASGVGDEGPGRPLHAVTARLSRSGRPDLPVSRPDDRRDPLQSYLHQKGGK